VTEIIRGPVGAPFDGCDFVVRLDEARRGTDVRILQLTDLQFIDVSQERGHPGKENPPDALEREVCDHIRSLAAQCRPDLIILTGDVVYGMFDDSGRVLDAICRLMDSLGIPWAPVFGNHDNECWRGVAWQCERIAASRFSLFRRGTVTGSGNYTVGVACGDELVRVLYMTCSNGGGNERDPEVVGQPGIYPDQARRIRDSAARIEAAQGRPVPAFMAFHIPVREFVTAAEAAGYRTKERPLFRIGVDVPAREGDFGAWDEDVGYVLDTEFDFPALLRACRIDGVFAGHYHKITASILWEGVRWTFGLKTGTCDYHPTHTGGTLITVRDGAFTVLHVPSLL
jgi:3',5'-cyclic AMP phosphodiesterase CpdA